jgi:hypothetical protein
MTWAEGPSVVELPDGRRIAGRGLRHGDQPDDSGRHLRRER